MKRHWKFAELDEKGLKKVHAMEEALEAVVLVMEPHYPAAELTTEQLARLQALEDELGVVLLALKQ